MNMRYHYSYGAPNDLLDVLIGGMIVEISNSMLSLYLLVVGDGKDRSTMHHPIFTINAAFSY